MSSLKEAANEFLGMRRIAVTGVSRSPESHGSNVVYRRLRDRGYEVFAVNPNADVVEDDTCYPSLASIPGGVDAVVIGTKPETGEETVKECEQLGITHVWMHRGLGPGSVSAGAAQYGRDKGMTVIDGACPCMFDPAADGGHKFMKVILNVTGKLPRAV